MDEIKSSAALEAEQTTALVPTAPAAEPELAEEQITAKIPAEDPEEESLVLKFRKPYKFEGKEYTEVDLSAMEDMTAADLCAVAKLANREQGTSLIPETTLPYAMYMAARASRKSVEFFKGLPPVEAMKLKNLVMGFLYGGDGEE